MKHFLLGACAVLGPLTLSCSDAETTGAGGVTSAQDVGQTRQFVVWNPDLGGGQLIQQHVDWHTAPCSANGQPLGGQVGVGRRCTGIGEDFLIWHRAYLNRLRNEFQRQGRTENIDPWYQLPPEMRSTANGWTAALQTAENNLLSMRDPATGTSFASLNRFGEYLESQYHNALHGIASRAYGESVVAGFMSPQSTYFFKIHGLIEWHLTRFLRGDFNWDGKSDLVMRNVSTGANQIWYMNDTTLSSRNNIPSTAVDSCQWYIGATPDLNFDGRLDLVWHGPGCNATSVWFMNGTTRTSSASLLNVNNAWRLIGHGDFNRDLRPDLVWRDNATNDVQIWVMNGTTRTQTATMDIPASWTPILVADITDNGPPDFIYRRLNGTTAEYAVNYTAGIGFPLGSVFTISGLSTDQFISAYAVGSYQQLPALADFLMIKFPPAALPGTWNFSRFGSLSSMGFPHYQAPTAGISFTINESIQGPR